MQLFAAQCHALFYLPGVAPKSYSNREKVKLFVNKLTSTHTQIPYDYYSLPYCHPHVHEESENLGERLSGDKIENSLYKLEMKRPQACEIVCKKVRGCADESACNGTLQCTQCLAPPFCTFRLIPPSPTPPSPGPAPAPSFASSPAVHQ